MWGFIGKSEAFILEISIFRKLENLLSEVSVMPLRIRAKR